MYNFWSKRFQVIANCAWGCWLTRYCNSHRKASWKIWVKLITNYNVGQCPTWWPPCRILVASSVQRRKLWWRPLLECRAVTLPRREAGWNLQGCAKLVNRYQPLVRWSSPYYQDMWRRYCCLASFFPVVDTCLSCEDIARQSCAMVRRWRF